MAKQPRDAEPRVEWTEGEFRVSLPLQGRVIDAKWRPGTTTVVRIRETGTENWSPGFETPLNGCSFVGLVPNTEYEIQVTHKNAAGEGPPTRLKCRTKPNGEVGKIIPFPKK
ncbi:MAG: fibronectin type III domain-containing protein [Truepera sp.]|nr:fibronectin type III domain-containing protein [Truepera sp.]